MIPRHFSYSDSQALQATFGSFLSRSSELGCQACTSKPSTVPSSSSPSLYHDTSSTAAMATLIPPVTNRPTYSCVRCAERKVRCDKQSPCDHCVKHKVQCVFRAPPAPRRRQKRVADVTLKDKVKRYEAALQGLGVNPAAIRTTSDLSTSRADTDVPSNTHATMSDASPSASSPDGATQIPTPASTVGTVERSVTTTQILHSIDGKSKFVEK